MDFNLTREQELVRKTMAEFTEAEVKPIAAETDRTAEYPRENIEKLFRYGVMGMCVPKQYGGAGADDISSAIAIEELSKQCASTGDIVATHNGLCCGPIINFGTEEQKKKYLAMLTTGHKVGAFALTEPNAGSDASKGTTVCEDKGDHWVMNGSKIFITNGYVAEVFVVFAMTDPSKGTKGISAFIVESSFPGFSVGRHEEKMGLHGSPTAEIVFEDCIIPKENLLGQLGKGFNIAMNTLDGGRIGIAAQALGIAEGAMNEAVEYTKGRVQFGKPISKFQNTQFVFADMEVAINAAKLLTYSAAATKGVGKRFTKEAAMAKLFASEAAMKITTQAVQMFGGYGYTRDYPVERMMRDAKITELYEGTSEIQRIVISGNVLGR
jgi:butyryl-CoA dehydrogenase